MINWIQGEKFKGVADFIYAPKDKLPGDYDNLVNTFDTALLGDIQIVYTHSMYVQQLFDVIGSLTQRFVVVTHNSDMNIDNRFSCPPNVIKWFSQNINVIHEKIESIPIGLENDMWFPQVNKKEKMLAYMESPKLKRKLVYMNHNVGTNPAKRSKPYDVLEKERWVTTVRGENGRGFDDYIQNIYYHPFVVCPEGNGIDTHRIWEVLYMNSIPITEANINTGFYKELPILRVNKWEDVTEDFLYMWWRDVYSKTKWNMNLLYFGYWKDKITNSKII